MKYNCRMRIGQDSVTWYDEEGNETMHIDSSNKVTVTKHESTNEPVAWMQNTTCGLYVIDHPDEWHCIPLYTHPQAVLSVQDQKKDEALRLALEALKKLVFLAEHEGWEGFDKQYEAITLIEQALENK